MSNSLQNFIRSLVRFVIQLILLLLAAGTFSWFNAWLYFGINTALTIAYVAVLSKRNPELLNARAKMPEDTQSFDKVFIAIYTVLTFITLIVAGLDASRFMWSFVPIVYTIVGSALLFVAFLFSLWAMASNPHFESTVRLQKDRNHQVSTNGPYQMVRHPGYLGMFMLSLSYPLVLGSWWAFIPATAMAICVIVRTQFEDQFLQQSLTGYKEYAGETRKRLIPFIW